MKNPIIVQSQQGRIRSAVIALLLILLFCTNTHAEIFPTLPATGEIDVVLHPGETVSPGEQRTVAFGVPFPRNLINNVSQLKVVDSSGNEIASNVQETMRWRSVVGDPSVDGVRAALFYVNVSFDSLTPQLIRVVYGQTRNLELNAPSDVRSTWVSTELGEDDVYPDNEGLSEPAVYATLPPSWMDTAVIRTRFVPKSDVSPDFQWHIDALENFGATSADQVGEVNNEVYVPITEKAPWLYDRAGVLWDAYYKTGDVRWMRAAHKASQFYAGRVDSTGRFTLATWADPKYSFSGGLIGDLIMTGDTELIATIRNIGNFQANQNYFLSNADRSWNERFFTYWFLGVLSAFEATGDESFRAMAQERAEHMFMRAKNPVGNFTPEGGLIHTKVAHDGGGGANFGQEPVMSPWMSALMADAAWRYYIHSEDVDALEFLANLADSVVEHSLYSSALNGEQYVMPYYMACGQTSEAAKNDFGFRQEFTDYEHALDVTGLIARGYWAKQKLGQTDTAPLLNAMNDLKRSVDYAFNKWTRGTADQPKYVLRPPRKYNWWFGTTSDLEWLVTSSPIPGDEEPGALPAPTLLQASSASSTTIDLSWRDNATDETAYQLERSSDGISFNLLANLPANSVTYTDTGLTPETVYFFRIRARRGADSSTYSNAASATTGADDDGGGGDDGDVATPTNLTVSTLEPNLIVIDWQDNSDNETNFEIARQVDGGRFAWRDRIAANSNSYVDTSIEPGVQYAYRVRAIVGQESASDYSEPVSVVTPTDDPVEQVSAPTSLTAVAQSTNSIQLSWNDNADNEQNYLIERKTDGANYQQVAQLPANANSYLNTELQANTNYSYRVRAQGQTVFSSFSNTADATTQEEVIDDPDQVNAPSNLTANVNSSRQVVLAWQDNSNNETNFEIQRQVNGGAFRWFSRIGANSTTFIDSSAEVGVQYAYRVRAIIGQQAASAYTNPVSVQIAEEDEPDNPASVIIPSLLLLDVLGANEIQLNWQDNSNNETNFEIARNVDNGPFRWFERIGANRVSFVDNRVEPGKRYGYRVRAIIGRTAASEYTDPKYATPSG